MAHAEGRQMSAINCLLNAKKFGPRELLALIIVSLSFAFITFHLYAGMYGHPEAHFYRSLHLTGILLLCFIIFPLNRQSWSDKPNLWTLIDVLCIILTLAMQIYYLWDIDAFEYRQVSPSYITIYDVCMGIILWVLVLEGTRRALGLPMVIIALFFTFQALYSDKMFWIFYGPNTSLKALTLDMYMQEGGIFGMPVGTIASFVVLFLIFGAFMEETGTGRTFIDLALGGFGAKVGGPAKAAVVGSAFFGMLSGSSVANVTTTGTFTIPLMKNVGYPNKFAGGVEACASTGGMFTPPIMGATAFVVAAYLGLPYITVAAAAAIPALCYYTALFATVDFHARKAKIKPLSKEEMPVVKEVLKKGAHLLIPIIALVYLLVVGYTAATACFWSIVGLFVISFFHKESRPGAESIVRVCEIAARATVVTTMACAAAGIIVSSTTLSGVGLKLGTQIVSLSGGQLWIALLLSAILAVILGMGLTTTAVYIIMVVTVIPPIEAMGVPPLAAHMYALFWGVLSNIIPPVAIASFAAAGIAKAGPMETAVAGFRIGIPGLLVFATFVYNPGLLMIGSVADIVINSVGCIAGVVYMSAAIQGYAFEKINPIFRVILAVCSLVVLSPRWDFTFSGMLVGIAIMAFNYLASKKNTVNTKLMGVGKS
ncbi:MAG: TRAP transporter fused permease subunit [Synergistaceae bacterium]|nr:TRAP transporter fused permease subunit [Synergistaceae bacterium]